MTAALASSQPKASIAMQRAAGEARIAVALGGGTTRLQRLYQQGAAKIRIPKSHDGRHLEAVLINVSGGLTGGDRFTWAADAGDGTALSVTTQACEKIYRAESGHAETLARITVGRSAALAWLPQEAILFDRSAICRRVEAELAPDARLLLLESAIIGRAAMGETVTAAALQDRWRIRQGGRLIHAEETRIFGDPREVASGPARLDGMTAFGSMVLIAPDAAGFLAPLRALAAIPGAYAGFSAITAFQSGKLVARFAAIDGLTLRRVLIPAVELLNRQALSIGGLPKVWRL
jgi:urease accessory protein